MKGRRKIPNALKTLRGTDQPCRMTDGAESPATNVVAVPRSGLKGTARKVFGIVAAGLIHKRLLEVVGVDLVVACAREMGLYHDMMRDVEREGATVEIITRNGPATVVNPKRRIAEGALANARSLAAEFGLTPASRHRVAALLADDAPKDDFAEFEEME